MENYHGQFYLNQQLICVMKVLQYEKHLHSLFSNVKINYSNKKHFGYYFKTKITKNEFELFLFRRVFFKGDSDHVYGIGDTIYRPRLGRTLSIIAEQGPSAFYEGELSDKIVHEIQEHGGIINRYDLETYHARVKPAIKVILGGNYTAYGVPPPASSAITLLILKIMDGMHRYRRNERFLWVI
jgi:gamma-glutamyltranspeptidase